MSLLFKNFWLGKFTNRICWFDSIRLKVFYETQNTDKYGADKRNMHTHTHTHTYTHTHTHTTHTHTHTHTLLSREE